MSMVGQIFIWSDTAFGARTSLASNGRDEVAPSGDNRNRMCESSAHFSITLKSA
jgi:hypothetical protein